MLFRLRSATPTIEWSYEFLLITKDLVALLNAVILRCYTTHTARFGGFPAQIFDVRAEFAVAERSFVFGDSPVVKNLQTSPDNC